MQYFGPKIVGKIKFNGFVAKEVYLSPKKERSIRKYGKSPKEVSFFERSSTGHPGDSVRKDQY